MKINTNVRHCYFEKCLLSGNAWYVTYQGTTLILYTVQLLLEATNPHFMHDEPYITQNKLQDQVMK